MCIYGNEFVPYQLSLVLKPHNLFRIIYGTCKDFKSRNNYQ